MVTGGDAQTMLTSAALLIESNNDAGPIVLPMLLKRGRRGLPI